MDCYVCICLPNVYSDITSHFCQFLESCIERTPDIMLFELAEELKSVRGVEVSANTIRKTMRRRGYTRKQVCKQSV